MNKILNGFKWGVTAIALAVAGVIIIAYVKQVCGDAMLYYGLGIPLAVATLYWTSYCLKMSFGKE
jgi:hypothetical protein